MKYRDKVLPIYLEETKDHIEVITNLLVELEQNPGNSDHINEIFRRVHTLKGGAASVGFSAIGEIAHRFENLLDDMRNSRVVLTPELFTELFALADVLRQLLEAAINGADSEEIRTLAEKLKAIAGEASQGQEQILRCQVSLQELCAMKAARVVVILKTLGRMGEIVASSPPEPMLLQGEFGKKFSIDLKTPHSAQEVRDALAKVPDVEEVIVSALEAQNPAPAKAPEKSNEGGNGPRQLFVRVDVAKLENMINLIGELVIERNRLAAFIAGLDSEHHDTQLVTHISNQLGRITGELQKEIMSSRMVPIAQVFGNLPRVARDTAKALNKDIQLTIHGEDTELDRTLVDKLRDPMVHLLRNAIDHGIESPSDRVMAGKPPTGQVKIEARHEENNIIIDVSDDGKGINFLSVIKKVVDQGLLSAEELETANQEELTSLIFLPGFSTADSVSTISGRGVGLDAVRNEIEKLGGSITVSSQRGSGTRFRIRLPLTLAIIQALLFTVSGRDFALPLANIAETLAASQHRSDFLHGSKVIRLREKIIPLVDMAEFFNLPAQANGNRYVLVVSDGANLMGLQVDSLIGKREIVIKPLGTFFAENRELAGVTLLGDGAIVPILDAAGIFRLSGNLYGDKSFNC